MRNILTITHLTLRIAARKRTLWGLLALVASVCAFVFYVSHSGGSLADELQLRVQYSYALAYGVLNLMVIAIGCFTIRSQIDGRQVHLLTAMPVKRHQIFVGQWLGVTGIAMLGQLILIVTLGVSVWFYSRAAPGDEKAEARESLATIRYAVKPQYKSYRDLRAVRIAEMRSTGRLSGPISEAMYKELTHDIRRDEQLVPPKESRTWSFDLGRKPASGEVVTLRYKFYADKRRRVVKGTWTLSATGKAETFSQTFEVFPFRSNTLDIPLTAIPESGRFDMTLVGDHDRNIIVTRESGLRLYYEDGTWVWNVVKIFICQLIHLAAIAAVGLTMGVAFTFAVSAFLSIVLFSLSISAGFFSEMIQESQGQTGVLEQSGVVAMQGGLWLTRGLQPPAVIEAFSTGVSIPLSDLAVQWLPGLIVYSGLAIGLGVYLFNQKELDKLPARNNAG